MLQVLYMIKNNVGKRRLVIILSIFSELLQNDQCGICYKLSLKIIMYNFFHRAKGKACVKDDFLIFMYLRISLEFDS